MPGREVTRLAPLLVLAAVIAATGCGAARTPSRPTGGSGVYGSVKRGPLKPVCEQGAACYGPAGHVRLTFATGGRTSRSVVAHTSTDAKGAYRLALAPGTYVVQGKVGIGGITPTLVRVQAGRYVRADLVLDTGIR